MTYEEKKAYLRQYRAAIHAAKDAARRLEEYRATYAGIKAVIISDMPRGGGTPRDLSDYVAKLDELEGDLLTAVDAYHAKAHEVEAVIDRVTDETQARLLRLRYLDGLTFERIAVEMSYSWRQVMRLHYRAVCDLDL